MNRRRFLEIAGAVSISAALGGCSGKPSGRPTPDSGQPSSGRTGGKADGTVYVASDTDPARGLTAAIAAAGGLKAIIKPGANVVLKPNAAWARTAEQAATTDPRIVAQMVRMCREAGAARVTVYEHTIDRPSQMVLGLTGIARAVGEAGGELALASSESDFAPLDVPDGKLMKTDTVAKALLEADVVINLPKAKTHSQTELTLGLKNLMGCNWNRQAWHSGPNLAQYIADYATAVKVDLTVLDASRVLMTNGPKGPGQTKDLNQVIVSYDPVAADSYACGLFSLKPADVPHVVLAGEMGLGEYDLTKITVRQV